MTNLQSNATDQSKRFTAESVRNFQHLVLMLGISIVILIGPGLLGMGYGMSYSADSNNSPASMLELSQVFNIAGIVVGIAGLLFVALSFVLIRNSRLDVP